jgi:hypothetical protein
MNKSFKTNSLSINYFIGKHLFNFPSVLSFINMNAQANEGNSTYMRTIDMRRLSRPPLHPFPLSAGCVPFELVANAALL